MRYNGIVRCTQCKVDEKFINQRSCANKYCSMETELILWDEIRKEQRIESIKNFFTLNWLKSK
ncbi:MAG: hypothetical protein ACI9AT_000414 [Ulvibacter sp.]|jgi:hypothetical protein